MIPRPNMSATISPLFLDSSKLGIKVPGGNMYHLTDTLTKYCTAHGCTVSVGLNKLRLPGNLANLETALDQETISVLQNALDNMVVHGKKWLSS